MWKTCAPTRVLSPPLRTGPWALSLRSRSSGRTGHPTASCAPCIRMRAACPAARYPLLRLAGRCSCRRWKRRRRWRASSRRRGRRPCRRDGRNTPRRDHREVARRGDRDLDTAGPHGSTLHGGRGHSASPSACWRRPTMAPRAAPPAGSWYFARGERVDHSSRRYACGRYGAGSTLADDLADPERCGRGSIAAPQRLAGTSRDHPRARTAGRGPRGRGGAGPRAPGAGSGNSVLAAVGAAISVRWTSRRSTTRFSQAARLVPPTLPRRPIEDDRYGRGLRGGPLAGCRHRACPRPRTEPYL